MMPAEFIEIARVVSSHGLKGEVAVIPAADLPFVLPDGLEVWFTPPPAAGRTGRVQGVRPGPKGPLLKVSGVDSIDAASALRGCRVLARAVDLPTAWLDDDDEIGAEGRSVVDEEHGMLGTITETIVTGANDVWVVHGRLGEVLIPVIDDVVLAWTDDPDEPIQVRLLPGLLDQEGES